MPRRQSNNPKRRIAPIHELDPAYLEHLMNEAHYTGSAHHKRIPADYGFDPPANPRPGKSLCDGSRCITLEEATALFLEGIRRGMISTSLEGNLPKYVWAVDSPGHAYEAKIERGTRNYHGYELSSDDNSMQQLVVKEWNLRCPIA